MTITIDALKQVSTRMNIVNTVLIRKNAVGTIMGMTIRISEKIRIENPTPAMFRWCKEHLVIDNPDYYKKERMGKWTGNIPREIWLFERNGNELLLPFGCLKSIWNLCVRGVPWKAEFAPLRQVNYKSSINLYPYQQKAVDEALKRKNGVLVMPCGSGKTQSGLEFISRIGGKALWLTHTADLLNQSRKRAESVLGYVGTGTITGGKVNIGNGITFATIQTMAKIDLSQYKDAWDIIVVDECQHCCGSPTKVTQFYKVISSLSARYKIGLTATPKRADGLERGMFALLGSVIYEVPREEVANTTCPVKVMQVNTGWYPDYDCVLLGDGTIDYHKVVDNMTQDDERFEKVIETIADIPQGEPTIVLANRVVYLQRLEEEYDKRHGGFEPSICLSNLGTSEKDRRLRKNSLSALNDGEIDCIFATYQLAKEGLDVPNLRYLVLATPEKDETTVIQSVGRVGRKAEGKEYGTVIDFIDDFGMYKGWAKKRANYYKKIDAEII